CAAQRSEGEDVPPFQAIQIDGVSQLIAAVFPAYAGNLGNWPDDSKNPGKIGNSGDEIPRHPQAIQILGNVRAIPQRSCRAPSRQGPFSLLWCKQCFDGPPFWRVGVLEHVAPVAAQGECEACEPGGPVK